MCPLLRGRVMSATDVVRHRWLGNGRDRWRCTRRVPLMRAKGDVCHGCGFEVPYTSIRTDDVHDLVNRPLAAADLALRLDIRAETVETAASVDWQTAAVGRA